MRISKVTPSKAKRWANTKPYFTITLTAEEAQQYREEEESLGFALDEVPLHDKVALEIRKFLDG